jgi:arginine decarboxylase
VNRPLTRIAPCAHPRHDASLTITIAGATATARTGLAAFDRALVAVGAENRNLIRLSSVIPPAASIVRARTNDGGEWGDRLYVVSAEQRATDPGAEAWAGVGWVQDERTGAGLFVEHEGGSEDEVRSLISDSLAELQVSRGIDIGPSRMLVTGIRCESDPVCALVLAAYGSESWDSVSSTSRR